MDVIPHKIGEPFVEPPIVFQLDVSDHIQYVDPSDYGLKDIKSIDPNQYFITSGDAVEKAKILYAHYVKLRDELQALGSTDQNMINYTTAIAFATEQAATMLEHLKKAKGDHCFLETEWDCHVLYVKAKDPRR